MMHTKPKPALLAASALNVTKKYVDNNGLMCWIVVYCTKYFSFFRVLKSSNEISFNSAKKIEISLKWVIISQLNYTRHTIT
jgi:hypothetical protein